MDGTVEEGDGLDILMLFKINFSLMIGLHRTIKGSYPHHHQGHNNQAKNQKDYSDILLLEHISLPPVAGLYDQSSQVESIFGLTSVIKTRPASFF